MPARAVISNYPEYSAAAVNSAAHWEAICANPLFKDVPYKVETNKWGHIVMSPATNLHGMYQAKIAALLDKLMGAGAPITDCSLQTAEGIKIADVAWASAAFIARNHKANVFAEAPELCVEILSPSNTLREMEEKKELYFARGAREFWVCDREGNMRFYKNTGQIANSELAGNFPKRVEL